MVFALNIVQRTQHHENGMKVLRTDNEAGYISSSFKAYLEAHGIQQQLTVAYTPQQNGVAEIMNHTLMDCTRSILYGEKWK